MVTDMDVSFKTAEGDHRNIVIADTLEVIKNVILFSISNYFLRFSNEYKRFHNVETSTYIRQHRDEYVVMTQGGEVKLRYSCSRAGISELPANRQIYSTICWKSL